MRASSTEPIKGLLPHGPHDVRNVLATHILKQTGSYEQASYAIQDTRATRVLPTPWKRSARRSGIHFGSIATRRCSKLLPYLLANLAYI